MNVIDLRKYGQPIIMTCDNVIVNTEKSDALKLTVMSLGLKFDISFKSLGEMNEFMGQIAGHNNTFGEVQ
jgi:hypothetical protein